MKQEFKFQGVVTFAEYSENEKDGKTYKKWQAVLEETGEQYPQMIKLDYFSNKDTIVPCPNEGDEIIAYYNIKAKEYNGKHYGENSVWRTEVVAEGTGYGNGQEMSDDDMPPAAPADKPISRNGKTDMKPQGDDLPF